MATSKHRHPSNNSTQHERFPKTNTSPGCSYIPGMPPGSGRVAELLTTNAERHQYTPHSLGCLMLLVWQLPKGTSNTQNRRRGVTQPVTACVERSGRDAGLLHTDDPCLDCCRCLHDLLVALAHHRTELRVINAAVLQSTAQHKQQLSQPLTFSLAAVHACHDHKRDPHTYAATATNEVPPCTTVQATRRAWHPAASQRCDASRTACGCRDRPTPWVKLQHRPCPCPHRAGCQ